MSDKPNSRDELEQSLSRRNAQAVLQELALFRKELSMMLDMIDAMSKTVATLSARVQAIEQTHNLARAERMGTGPSVPGG